MICHRCGRELSDDAPICTGCGMSQIKAERPKALPIKEYISNEINWGKKSVGVSVVVSWLAALAIVLVGFGASTQFVDYGFMVDRAGSMLGALFDSIDIDGFFDGVQNQIDEGYEKEISGTVLVMNDDFVDRVLVEEYQKKNGEWYREERVDDKLTVKFYRFERNEDWLNTHIFSLYPNITKVDSYEFCPLVSGHTTHRIAIPAEDENIWLNAVIVDDGVNNFIFTVETTKDVYTEYEYIIEDWINTLELSDISKEVSDSDE